MADALHYSILNAVANAIRGLGLDGLTNDDVYVLKAYTDREAVVNLPAIEVVLYDKERILPGTFETMWRGYPVLIVFLTVNNQDLAVREAELKWREQVLDYFERTNVLTGVPEVWNRTIETGFIVDLELFKNKQVFSGAILISFWITKDR